MNTPEYGNDTACSNCGDEWDELDDSQLCSECAEVLRKADEQ